LAVRIEDQNEDIWIYNLRQDVWTRLTLGGINQRPIWTRDGRSVTYAAMSNGALNLFSKPADANGVDVRLTTSEIDQTPQAWSPDGRVLIVSQVGSATNTEDVFMLRDRKTEPVLVSSAAERGPRLSPDGHWLAYGYSEGSDWQVRVQAFPEARGTWQISTEGGDSPRWSSDGRELFYLNGNTLMAVQVSTASGFSAAKPVKLFETDFRTEDYDVASDGRFLVIQPELQESAPTLINVMLNWTALLPR
jgi:eukaryotic-like serine/threonine-protein kinase